MNPLHDKIQSKLQENRNFGIITKKFDNTLEALQELIHSNRVILIQNDTFLVDDAKKAIKEAYIAEDKTKYIVLVASAFNMYAQNSLLKILEEPPKNIVFILMTNSKSTLLPTVRSRLSMLELHEHSEKIDLKFNILKLDLNIIFGILQEYKYASKHEVQLLIETIFRELIGHNISLEEEDFTLLANSLELLGLNSNNQFVLSNILLNTLDLLHKRQR